MDKQQAQNIIRETFESPFDNGRFSGFIKNLLNRIDDASFTYKGNYIPDAYKQYIKTLERIGKFSDGENNLDILVITLQKETSLERARTMQRNFIAWYLNGSRGGEMKDAALVAYVSPDQADWRFSLVKMDYTFEKTKTGKMKVKEEFTPARRWSFLVGTNEKSHTAQSRLVNILADDEQAPTLVELEKAFDIETVTKEFFLKYRELFLRTKEALDKVVKKDPKIKADFEAKGVDTVNFAKKLLGQIVFLYFLQKKGWFGVGRDDDWGTGSKHFLRSLFAKKYGDYQNFFNDILEPLFYEALRIDRGHDDDYYSRFNCKIPFLNGGLFDPIENYDWVHTDIHLPDNLFSNSRKTKEGDEGDGILDVFDRYNFTVREDEPLEREVAIDPELLGKAYEKFNAIRRDNFDEFTKVLKSGKKGEENKFNKKFGVFYTPREIVHYMCKQSLINYLFTRAEEAKLSGVIKRQDMEDLIEVGELITEHEATALIKQEKIRNGSQKSTEYTALLSDSIRENAAAIDNWLVEITLCDPAVGSGAFPVGMMNEIVRARNVLSVFLNDRERNDYEFKRRCIEYSLYGVDIDPGAVEIAKLRLWLSLVVDEEDIKNIKPLPNLDYKIVCGNSLLGVEKDLFNQHLFNDLEKLKPLHFNETNPTKKQDYKKQIDDLISQITHGHTEFDFEVYFSEVFHAKGGFDVVIANPPYVYRNADIDHLKDYFKANYFNVSGNYDLYKFFIEKSLHITRSSGVNSLITNSSYILQHSFEKTRKFLLSHSLFKILAPLGPNVFEATVDSAVYVILKSTNHDSKVKIITPDKPSDIFNTKPYFINQTRFNDNDSYVFDYLLKEREYEIVKNLFSRHPNLESAYEFGVGINTGYIKSELTSKVKVDNRFHPMVRGSGISKYGIPQTDGFIMYDRVFVRSKGKLGRTLPDEKFFTNPKILVVRTRNLTLKQRIVATIDYEKKYNLNRLSNIIAKEGYSLEGLLGVLNSKLYNWLYSKRFYDYEIKPIYLRSSPLCDTNNDQLNELVITLLKAKSNSDPTKETPQEEAKVKVLQREIDQLVYTLYGLTKEEIKIVEGEIK